jgi:hypothetical protein
VFRVSLVAVRALARCRAPLEQPSLHYTLLLDLDPKHRAYEHRYFRLDSRNVRESRGSYA